MKNWSMTIACALAAAAALAGPAKKDPVAEGFADWDGIDAKNYIFGRQITPSDLRHRSVVVFHFDATKLQAELLQSAKLANNMGMPQSHMTNWDTLETLPRDTIALAVIHGECDTEAYKLALKPPKDAKEEFSQNMQAWSAGTYAAIYGEKAKLVGADEPPSLPYVQVLLPGSTAFDWKGTAADANGKSFGEISKLIKKGKDSLSGWRELYGVAEVQHFKKAEKAIRDGKPATTAFATLKPGIKDKDPEKAKEAQTMYDALYQYKSDLTCRIMHEFQSAPARAFVDIQRLMKLFPTEKKNLQSVDSKIKQNKSALGLGKMFAKFLEWNRPDFTFKNASEAKKAATEVTTKWKKQLDLMAQDQSNSALAGEAALLSSFLDGYADVLMTKVPQK